MICGILRLEAKFNHLVIAYLLTCAKLRSHSRFMSFRPRWSSPNEFNGEMSGAVIASEPFPTSVQGSVPLQPPPDQPLKFDPGEGEPVRVTTLPAGYV
jgi:hypothetical protein